jgi:hypothetical protein
MTFAKDLIGGHSVTVKLPVAGATAGTDFDVTAFRAPFPLTVTAVRFLPDAALTGATATATTLSVINKGQSGAGAVSMAAKAFVTGEDAVAFDEEAITLSGTPANLNAAEGDIINVVKTHASTGTAISGSVEIDYVSRGS